MNSSWFVMKPDFFLHFLPHLPQMFLIFIDFLIFDILKASLINRVEKNAVYERSFLSYHLGIVNWAH